MVIVYPVRTGLYVNLTNRCPCACEFCLRQNGPGIYGSGNLWLDHEPSVEEVIAAVDGFLLRGEGTGRAPVAEDSDGTGFTELVFCGYGEPTERLDDLLAVARHVREIAPNLPIRINTNGLADLIHGRATAGDLKGLIDTVSISLNTPDADEYFRICHPKFGPESYAAMLAYTKACAAVVSKVVMTVVDEPVTSKENQKKCRAIAESLGATLRVRPFES